MIPSPFVIGDFCHDLQRSYSKAFFQEHKVHLNSNKAELEKNHTIFVASLFKLGIGPTNAMLIRNGRNDSGSAFHTWKMRLDVCNRLARTEQVEPVGLRLNVLTRSRPKDTRFSLSRKWRILK